MMEDRGALVLSVNEYGRSCYEFRRVDMATSQRSFVNMKKLSGKGVGTLATVNINQATKIYGETSSVVCVVGDNENYICKNCFSRVQKKVKVRADCNCLTYCSDECLHAAGEYLDVCGPIIAKLQLVQEDTWKDTIQLLKLAINYVYVLATAPRAAEVATLQHVMDLEPHPEVLVPVLQDAAQWLLSSINVAFPVSVLAVLAYRGFDLYTGDSTGTKRPAASAAKALYTLLRVIKYNAQPLPVHGIQKVQLLTLLPSVARVNHSCVPNCMLVYDVQQFRAIRTEHTAPIDESQPWRYGVTVSLVALRDIQADEELVVSYLQPLCSSLDLRQSLLKQAFQFDCRCNRCLADSARLLTVTTASAQGHRLEQLLVRLSASSNVASTASVAQLNELMAAAEQAANTPEGFANTVSTAHDSASYVLHQSLSRIKYLATTPNKSNMAQEQTVYLTLAVRSSVLISQCWVSIGCGSVLSRIEVVVSGSNYAVQLQKVGTSTTSGDEAVVNSIAKAVSDLKSQLQDVVTVLRSVHSCESAGVSSDGGVGNDDDGLVNSTVGSPSLYLQRDTSSGGYVKMLHAKALSNLAALY